LLVEQLHPSPLRSLTMTLVSRLEPIAALWQFLNSYGIVEGFHKKVDTYQQERIGSGAWRILDSELWSILAKMALAFF